jgi:3-oxoacyl-[acyl-carrier-protein] synthase-3
MSSIRSVILGSGSYLPDYHRPNSFFEFSQFYNEDGSPLNSESKEIVKKFEAITGIKERTVLSADLMSSDMGTMAAERAITAAGIDRESIDQIIVAHNFGDVSEKHGESHFMPSVASKIKNKLGIQNENCVPYDLIFGCPGWVQAMIQADVYIKSGYAKKCLVIGTESLARVTDKHDRDAMIFSDGAGAVILGATENAKKVGLLEQCAMSHTCEELDFLSMGPSFHNPQEDKSFIKMKGRKIYNYALSNVPRAIKACLDKSDLDLDDVTKILIHQANEKMDLAIGERLYKLYGHESMPATKMPMHISRTGNNSVATVPILYDMIVRNELEGHEFHSGDILVMASVGAGMNINAFSYRIP